jgi:hypothetical protein
MTVLLVPPERQELKAACPGAANDTGPGLDQLLPSDDHLRRRLKSLPAAIVPARAADPRLLEFACALHDAVRGWPRHFPTLLPPGSEREILLKTYCALAFRRHPAVDILTCPGVPASVTVRMIARLIAAGTLERAIDPLEPDQLCVRLSNRALDQMERWLSDAHRRFARLDLASREKR